MVGSPTFVVGVYTYPQAIMAWLEVVGDVADRSNTRIETLRCILLGFLCLLRLDDFSQMAHAQAVYGSASDVPAWPVVDCGAVDPGAR